MDSSLVSSETVEDDCKLEARLLRTRNLRKERVSGFSMRRLVGNSRILASGFADLGMEATEREAEWQQMEAMEIVSTRTTSTKVFVCCHLIHIWAFTRRAQHQWPN